MALTQCHPRGLTNIKQAKHLAQFLPYSHHTHVRLVSAYYVAGMVSGGASGKDSACQNRRLWFYPWIRKIPWRRAQLSGKEPACQRKRLRFYPWIRKIPWRRAQQPTPVFLPGESHGQKSLARYSPWGHRRAGHTLAVTVLSACCTVK